MATNYPALFEPFKIGSVEIKNKYFMAPMGTLSNVDEQNAYTPDAVEYFARRARGGVGLIITGANWVDNEIEQHEDAMFPCPNGNTNYYEKMAVEITDKVHPFGTKIFMQLTAGLGRSAVPGAVENDEFVAPSKTVNRWIDKDCRELTTDEIDQIVIDFGKAAAIAKKTGFDGVEIHAMHEGYLLDCFTMKLFNQRTDKYGGTTIEERIAFPVAVVKEIKKVCGEDFPVILRFSIKSYIKQLRQGGLPDEKFEELGRDIEESLKAAPLLESAGYDAFDADAGSYDSWYWAHPPMYFNKGMYLPLTEQLKKVVSVPVMVAGRMDDPDLAVNALKTRKLDAIGLGRPLLTDENYVNKVFINDLEDIRPCLGCHDGCFGRAASGGRGSCAVNPECGREPFVMLKKTTEPKKVVIIGGGPAGLEAARVSALRGHKVVLFESTEKVGGNLNIGGQPSFKHDDLDLAAWYSHQMDKYQVTIHLNTKATKQNVLAEKPDVIVTAEGSKPVLPPISGIEQENIFLAEDVLTGKKKVGEHTLIIGGGLVGCELALHLVKDQGKKATIVEALPGLLMSGPSLPPMNYWMLTDLLNFNKVQQFVSSKVMKITGHTVMIEQKDEKQELQVDNVVLAVGYRSVSPLFEELKSESPYVYNIGDSKKVRNIRAAIWDGFEVARNI